MKTTILLALGAVLLATQAQAISRYQSGNYGCGETRAIVAREGAAIFRYPSSNDPGHTLYDRFVAHQGYCAHGEEAVPMSIPTASGACSLLRCRQATHDEDWRFDN